MHTLFKQLFLLRLLFIASILSLSVTVNSQESSNLQLTPYEHCLLNTFKRSPAETTVSEISKACKEQVMANAISKDSSNIDHQEANALILREVVEVNTKNTPFILPAHRANYLLPAVFIKNPNNAPFNESFGPNSLDNTEIQFQLSVKAPITDDFIFKGDSIWVGYTMRAFWQAYNGVNSRPFRETNHEPEFIWETKSPIKNSILGFYNRSNQLVLNHQSNGQSGDLSRSWNRVILNSLWEKDRLAVTISAWNRIKEDPKTDENPKIETYIGNLQLMASYGENHHRLSGMLRGNPTEGKGAAELTWSFPLPKSEKIRGMVKYFDGYGESLLDYDIRTRSIGIGFLVTDWY